MYNTTSQWVGAAMVSMQAFYCEDQSSNPALWPQLLAAKNGAKDEKEIGIVPYLKRPIHSLAH